MQTLIDFVHGSILQCLPTDIKALINNLISVIAQWGEKRGVNKERVLSRKPPNEGVTRLQPSHN